MLQEFLINNLPTLLIVLVVTLCLKLFFQRPAGIPPGPWLTLPIIGNLFQVSRNPVMSFRRMRKKYGDVFSVYFANRLVIAINGMDNLKEAFVKNGDVFSDRPNVFMVNLISKNKGVLGSNGEVWKEQRRFALMTLRNLGMGKNVLEGKIHEETTAFVEELIKLRGKAFDIRFLIGNSISNVISAIVFGKRFEFDDPKFVKFLRILDETISTPPVLTFFPFLRFLPGDFFRFKSLKSNVEMALRELVDPSLKEHMLQYDEDNVDDFISAYIKEMKNKEKQGDTNSSIDKDNMRVTIWNLFIAGTETTSTTIRWLMLFFLHFPEIQDKCFAEIQEKVGCHRTISVKDKTDLPYLNATILETLRHARVVPLSVMHTVSRDIMFKGYRIPKDAIVMPVLDSVLYDSKIWGDPENFRPERFLDENGRLIKSEEHIPFSLGPRSCLGESLARMELFLFLSTMIQKFKFVNGKGSVVPTLEGRMGFVHSPQPFMMEAVLRK